MKKLKFKYFLSVTDGLLNVLLPFVEASVIVCSSVTCVKIKDDSVLVTRKCLPETLFDSQYTFELKMLLMWGLYVL
jgi:hypothetical protein